jgi:hypothetical protein
MAEPTSNRNSKSFLSNTFIAILIFILIQGELSRFAIRKPDTFGVSSILIEAEERLAEMDDALRGDRLLREAELHKAAEEREQARKLVEERAAARAVEERKKRELYESLAREYGAASGLVVHTTVRRHIPLFRASLTMNTPTSQPCAGCATSNEMCQGLEGKACNVCAEKHAPCSLIGKSLLYSH